MTSQTTTRGCGSSGDYVANELIDGGINGDRLRRNRPELVVQCAERIDAIAVPAVSCFAGRAPPDRWRSICGRARNRSEKR